MKKSVILNEVFGSRVMSYHEIEPDILVVELKDFTWRDLTPKMIQSFIDIQPCTEDTIRLSLEFKE